MNHPTVDVEELLELAHEAMQAGDTQESVVFLRKAASIAPLRKDIRNRLAMALEGTPVSVPSGALKQSPSTPKFEDFSGEQFESFDPNSFGAGRDSISQIARRAFEAATETTSKAGSATRRLTNILQQGLGSWKSGRIQTPLEQDSSSALSSTPAMFQPEADLEEYLDQQSGSIDFANPDPLAEDHPETMKVVKNFKSSRLASKTPPATKRKTRPSDVEDVLAAGIGGLIEVASFADKKKVLFCIIYLAMGIFFGYACFDISRKFPETGRHLSKPTAPVAASVGSFSSNSLSDPAQIIAEAQILAKTDSAGAINLLKQELDSGRIISNREIIRAELATVLNEKARRHLKNNELNESVNSYREAMSFRPNDGELSVMLANALYYQATMGEQSVPKRKEILHEAEALLNVVTKNDPLNLQAHRLLALVYEGNGKTDNAKTLWAKVKALAPQDSATLAEAMAHLK